MNKQFMIVKLAQEVGAAAMELIPFGGVVSEESARQTIAKLAQVEPGSLFMMQEVGAA